MQSTSENDLLEKWRNGDERAFDKLFELHFYKLYRFALRHTNNPELAEELVMDCMLKVWQKQNSIQPNSCSLLPFLMHLLKAGIVDNYRKKRIAFTEIEEITQEPASPVATDDHLHASELSVLYREGMAYLTPQKQLILEMRQHQELSYKEIGLALKISPKTVDRHLTESVSFIRKFIRKHTHVSLLALLLLY